MDFRVLLLAIGAVLVMVSIAIPGNWSITYTRDSHTGDNGEFIESTETVVLSIGKDRLLSLILPILNVILMVMQLFAVSISDKFYYLNAERGSATTTATALVHMVYHMLLCGFVFTKKI